MKNYQISKNFQLSEFAVSRRFPALAKEIRFGYTESLIVELLVTKALQRIRDKFGAIQISSGKRTEKLNAVVGGSKVSDHLTCSASDFSNRDFQMFHIMNWIVFESNIDFKQVIYYPIKCFIHISINLPGEERRREALQYLDDDYIEYKRIKGD